VRVNAGSIGTYCVGFSLTPIAARTIMTLRHNTLAAGTIHLLGHDHDTITQALDELSVLPLD
jgi:hypothetical protein